MPADTQKIECLARPHYRFGDDEPGAHVFVDEEELQNPSTMRALHTLEQAYALDKARAIKRETKSHMRKLVEQMQDAVASELRDMKEGARAGYNLRRSSGVSAPFFTQADLELAAGGAAVIVELLDKDQDGFADPDHVQVRQYRLTCSPGTTPPFAGPSTSGDGAPPSAPFPSPPRPAARLIDSDPNGTSISRKAFARGFR